jgi:hypothetical protein
VRSLVTTMMIVALATPAYAQMTPNLFQERKHLKTDVEVQQERERESAYKSGISKIPDPKAKADPWGNVRGAGPQSDQSQRPASK